MIRCDTEEERQQLKDLIWACYYVTSALTKERKEAIRNLNKAMEAIAGIKL